jgi:hypothetical protein
VGTVVTLLNEPYVEKVKELMAPPSFDKPQED